MTCRVPRWGLADVAVLVVGGVLLPLLVLSALLAAGLPQHSSGFLLLAAATPWIVFAGWPLLTTRLQGNGVRIDLGYAFRRSDLWWGLGGGVACFLLATPVGVPHPEAVRGLRLRGRRRRDPRRDAPRWVLVAVRAHGRSSARPWWRSSRSGGWCSPRSPSRSRVAARRVPGCWCGPAVWSTVLFAGIHVEPVRIPVLLTIGAVLAYLRARTGRVGASVVAHAVNNLPGAIAMARPARQLTARVPERSPAFARVCTRVVGFTCVCTRFGALARRVVVQTPVSRGRACGLRWGGGTARGPREPAGAVAGTTASGLGRRRELLGGSRGRERTRPAA